MFPNLDEKFQNESLDILGISKKDYQAKILDTSLQIKRSFSHPYNLLNEPLLDSLKFQNDYKIFKEKFLKKNSNKEKFKNFY